VRPLPTGFYPFWFLNSRLEEDEIRWQIRQMASQGIRGFFLHCRQGMDTPYLSEAFFRLMVAAVDEARKTGLVVHLYDEFPYPSGAAGGEVTLGEPAFYATALVLTTHDLPAGPARLSLTPGKILAATAYPLRDGSPVWSAPLDLRPSVGMIYHAETCAESGLTPYNRKRYWASHPAPVLETVIPDTPHRLFVAAQTVNPTHKYFGHFVDPLNPEAIRRFISLTHERWRARLGSHFGKTIVSIFSDETHASWSALMPGAFIAEYGRPIDYAALAAPDHPYHAREVALRHRLAHKLFEEAFDKPIARWCHSHGLAHTGEKTSYRLSQLRHMDFPGCEPGHFKAGGKPDLLKAPVRGNARSTASAGYFYGKQGALDECYHSLGWSGTLLDARLMADGLLLFGIRYLVPHGFFYSTHGLRKHDAPPSFFFQAPFWPLFGHLSRRVEAVGRVFENTRMDARLLLLDPASASPARTQQDDYAAIHEALARNHLDYLVVDTDILESAVIENGCVRVRDITAAAVVMPPMPEVEPPLRAWLNRFAAAGGKVIRCASPFDNAALLKDLAGVAAPSLRATEAGRESTDLYVVHRVGQDRHAWLVLNTSARAFTVDLDAGQPLREEPLPPADSTLLEKQGGAYRRAVAPFEGFMLVSAPPSQAEPEPALLVRATPGRRARFRALNPNLLRMGQWRMSLLDEAGRPGPAATVETMPVASQLQKSRLPFAPEVLVHVGRSAEFRMPPLVARYEFEFVNEFSGAVQIVMEPDSIRGEWSLSVNGAAPIGPAAFAPCAAHVRGSLAVDATAMLRPGPNTLRLDVRATRPDHGLLNPLYLAGGFGVAFSPLRLTAPKSEGSFEDYLANGLPFYAGAIEYETTFRLDRLPPEKDFILDFDFGPQFQEAAELSINNGPWLPAPWLPYRVKASPASVRAGENRLAVRVHTTLIRSFEGQWFDTRIHAHRSVEEPAS